ncbi:MAG: dihydropteroate synthase [Acidobacteria bacterium]|nr:dihydropteroate synthase [Acidobacteriota bacterium]
MELRFRGGSWDFSDGRVRLLGVLNVTPDSFSDGGRYESLERALERGIRMAEEGADAIDVGGESTRPGSDPVSVEEELSRVVPVIESLAKSVSVPISIDTMKAEVARRAVAAGASIVNDVTAGTADEAMNSVVAGSGAGYILMHMRGTPKTMQRAPRYDDVVAEVGTYLAARVQAATQAGCDPRSLMVDPGIGFGKKLRDNLLLINRLETLTSLGRPILVGASRKSFIGAITGQTNPELRLEGTIASGLFAVRRGAIALRVHDVAPMKRALQVWREIDRANDGTAP